MQVHAVVHVRMSWYMGAARLSCLFASFPFCMLRVVLSVSAFMHDVTRDRSVHAGVGVGVDEWNFQAGGHFGSRLVSAFKWDSC